VRCETHRTTSALSPPSGITIAPSAPHSAPFATTIRDVGHAHDGVVHELWGGATPAGNSCGMWLSWSLQFSSTSVFDCFCSNFLPEESGCSYGSSLQQICFHVGCLPATDPAGWGLILTGHLNHLGDGDGSWWRHVMVDGDGGDE
jgi:hypothetical protein